MFIIELCCRFVVFPGVVVDVGVYVHLCFCGVFLVCVCVCVCVCVRRQNYTILCAKQGTHSIVNIKLLRGHSFSSMYGEHKKTYRLSSLVSCVFLL